MKPDVEAFVEDYLKEIKANSAAVFLGAGASVPAGYVDWRELLRPVAKELNLDIDQESDLVAVAQYHVNSNGMNRHRVSQAILDALGEDLDPTENHKLLAELPISTYWTTNYDRLIESSLKSRGKVVDVKYTVNQLANSKARRDAVVYKMHGDIEHPQEAVITKDDYEIYHKKYGAFINSLSGDLISKTFVFIGFGFSDPNLDYVLSRVRVSFEKHARRHYAFFKRRTIQEGETEAQFENAAIRQALMIEDLKRFNIKTILVDNYDEITEALQELVRRNRQSTVFVSASASHFEPWGEAKVTQFMHALGGILIDNSYRVATGLGLGVGNALFTGALEKVYRSSEKHIDDYLLIRPFPQFVEDPDERQSLWHRYRKEFIPSAGIAIFLFGNKVIEGEVREADGMIREFEIAKEDGLVVLPIGATGYTANALADRVLSHPENYPNLRPKAIELLRELANPVESLEEILQKTTELLKAVR